MLRKSTSFALVLGVVIAACSPDRQPPPPPAATPAPTTMVASATAMSIDPRMLSLKSLYAASASDPAAAARLYAEDATKRFGDLRELRGRPAIEGSLKAEIAKLEKPAYGASRLWIKGDTLIADEVVHASVGGRAVGIPQLSVYWFDPSGLIKTHHTYRNERNLDQQIAGLPGAIPVVDLPASIETHVAQDTDDEAAAAAVVGRWQGMSVKESELGHVSVDAFATILSDDVTEDVWHLHLKGKAQYLTELRRFYAEFANESFANEHVWAIDGFVISEYVLHATRTTTGKPIAMVVGEVLGVANGRVTGDWAYIDEDAYDKRAP
jgi:hypothetical protein